VGQFSEILMDHFQDPRHRGLLPGADRTGVARAPGGAPTVTLYLKLDGGRIRDCRFEAEGCGVTIACGSMLAELLRDRSMEEAAGISVDMLVAALGGVPDHKRFSAVLAIDALGAALGQQPPGEGA
jgi:NifU-like protein